MLRQPPLNNYPTCAPIKIDRNGVEKLLKNLQQHKATGPDLIPNLVLKTCSSSIAPILALIYQRSLDSGKLPSDWLTANISAAFKKGNRHLAENYRPISLTSVPCKILEHIICRHLLKHLENFKILTHLNHGFRSGYSCETQLLTTADDLLSSFDNNKQIDIAILDFSKAFDTVPHKKTSLQTVKLWYPWAYTVLVGVLPHKKIHASSHQGKIIQTYQRGLWSTPGYSVRTPTLSLPHK